MKKRPAKLNRTVFWVFVVFIILPMIYLLLACFLYPTDYVRRVITWGKESVYDYQEFPERSLENGNNTYYFREENQDDKVRSIFEKDARIDNLETFLTDTGTQAFIVIRDDRILYESYFNGAHRDSIVTSFSVAKSFDSAMIGIAIEEGYIQSVYNQITDYLPELAVRDRRFKDITIRDLLMMSSGIRYFEDIPLLSDDGIKTYLFPDMRYLALNLTHIFEPPGKQFIYNNYNPLLLGMIPERVTGKPVSLYLQEKIWKPIGMEFAGSWSLDSMESGFEKMESGINAKAIDFAKFGRLYLENGTWEGVQVIPSNWVIESISMDKNIEYDTYYPDEFIFKSGLGYYKYMWWGLKRGEDDFDFSAYGNLGQFIYVSPKTKTIIIRNGEKYGIEGEEWLDLFFRFASEIGKY